jgi:hypothetical protein
VAAPVLACSWEGFAATPGSVGPGGHGASSGVCSRPLVRLQGHIVGEEGLVEAAGHPIEAVEVALVGLGRGVQVLLGGLDVGVPESVHDRGEVGPAGQQPGGVGVAQVLHSHVEADAGGLDHGQPDPDPEGVARDRGARGCGEEQVVTAELWALMCSATASSQSCRTARVRGSLSLG